MLKTVGAAFRKSFSKETCFLAQNTYLHEQIRTTYILKRKFPPLLHKKGSAPKPLRSRHYVYDLIKNTSFEKQPDIDLILTSYVEGLGNAGERVTVKSQYAYNNILLPGLGIYETDENIEEFKKLESETQTTHRFSSPTASLTLRTLSRITLSVIMNKENPWTLQPWHIKASFRKCSYVVPEEAITLPEKPIIGPDMNLESKEFFVIVTINNSEKVNVRCRLHHWSTNIVDRIPHIDKFWEEESEPVYPEFEEVLSKIPKKGASADIKQFKL